MLSSLSRKTLLFSRKKQGGMIIGSELCSNCQHINSVFIKRRNPTHHQEEFQELIICPWLITFNIPCVWPSSEELQAKEWYKDGLSPQWKETRSVVRRCCRPWDWSLSCLPPALTCPSRPTLITAFEEDTVSPQQFFLKFIARNTGLTRGK